MERPNVRPPTPQRTPKRIVMPILKEFCPVMSSQMQCPSGTARKAPSSGRSSQAKAPCTIQ